MRADEPSRLLAVLYHEIGHLRLGHSSKSKPVQRLPIRALTSDELLARLRIEDEADKWAAERLKALGPTLRKALEVALVEP